MEPEKTNKAGFVIFFAAFAASILFFGYVALRNPGPIDQKWTQVQAQVLSSKELKAREVEWRKSTVESIARGQEIYKVNCQFCHAQTGSNKVLGDLSKGQARYGLKETDLYRTIYYGIPKGVARAQQVMPRQQNQLTMADRWAVVHYLRSLSAQPPESTSSDWSELDKENIW